MSDRAQAKFSPETELSPGFFSYRRLHGVELEAECGGVVFALGNGTLTLLFLVALVPLVDERFTAGRHVVHHPGEFLCSGYGGT